MEKWTQDNIPDLSGKTIIVTGGNSGLGYESVKAFATKGATVILASRSVENGEAAKAQMGKVVGRIDVMQLDLQDFASIEEFVEQFNQKHNKLDILLNNAGIMTTPYFKTKDGLEGQIGTNHFGHFKLTAHLLPLLRNTPSSRVVNVSSIAHQAGKMDFNNLMFQKGGYSPIKAYGRSKLANLLFTYELQRFFEQNKIDSIAVAAHPGVSSTNLMRHIDKKLIFRVVRPIFMAMTQEAARGALPQIRAAVAPDVQGGEYYGPHGFREMKGYPVRVKSTPASHNAEQAHRLWEVSQEITGVQFK